MTIYKNIVYKVNCHELKHRTIVLQRILSRAVYPWLLFTRGISQARQFFQGVIANFGVNKIKNAGHSYFACKFPSDRDPIIFISTKSDKVNTVTTKLLQLGLTAYIILISLQTNKKVATSKKMI